MFCENVTISIPGLTRDYVFYHTSDSHIAWADPDDSAADREMAQAHAKKWNQSGIFPLDALDELLHMAQEDNADGIFLCGDIADYHKPATVRYIREKLANCGCEALYVCGNHEGASYVENVADIRTCYPDYSDMMHGSPAFWVRDFGEFLVAGLDNGDKKITPEQIKALRNVCADGRPILLLVHIPVFTKAMEGPLYEKWGEDACNYFVIGYGQDPAATPEFCGLVRDSSNPIVAVFAGHVHFAHQSELAPGRTQYISAPTFDGKVRKITLTSDNIRK